MGEIDPAHGLKTTPSFRLYLRILASSREMLYEFINTSSGSARMYEKRPANCVVVGLERHPFAFLITTKSCGTTIS
ncbi:hypothetical protein Hanom_Chr04g00342121 [Helianthus anomalus]